MEDWGRECVTQAGLWDRSGVGSEEHQHGLEGEMLWVGSEGQQQSWWGGCGLGLRGRCRV